MKERQYLEADGLILAQDLVRFGGMQLQYTLSVRRAEPNNRFTIGVMLGEERAVSEAGEHLEIALEHYNRIVAGIVTPCTLEDVVRDFEYSRRNLGKKLYKQVHL